MFQELEIIIRKARNCEALGAVYEVVQIEQIPKIS